MNAIRCHYCEFSREETLIIAYADGIADPICCEDDYPLGTGAPVLTSDAGAAVKQKEQS